MLKKYIFITTAALLSSLLFVTACTNTTNKISRTDQNESAEKDRLTIQTKNVTRIDTDDPVKVAVQTSQIVWPSTSKENRPSTVLIGMKENWKVNLPAVKLIHHPNNGPLLYAEKDQIPELTLKELQRLKPLGSSSNDGVQVILVGDFSEKVTKKIKNNLGLKVDMITGSEPTEMAKKIDAYYANASDGKLPPGVIIGSIDEVKYTIPAANWIAHMQEALLYVKKDQIPKATEEALQNRKNKANIYVLGPESVISKDVEKNLQQYGKVVRISGNTPEDNAIAFAKYKDNKTKFGWGVTEPGHGLTFARLSSIEAILPTAAFAHLGKHAPLLVMQNADLTSAQHEYLMSLQPKFTDDPTIGPYNHAYVIGSEKNIPFGTQGMIDQMLEIIAEDGDGHSNH